MNLLQIKAMFSIDSLWKCDRTKQWEGQKGILRQVSRHSTNELIWNIGFINCLFTRWPKQSEIIEATPGLLKFQYEENPEIITFSRLIGDEAEQARLTIQASLAAENARLDALAEQQKLDDIAEKASCMKMWTDRVIAGEKIPGEQLVEMLQHLKIPLSPGTIGAFRKKVKWVNHENYSYQVGKMPRFTKHCPVAFYRQIRAHFISMEKAAA
jgi:hypothetical protein